MENKIKLNQKIFVKGNSRGSDKASGNTAGLIETVVSKVGKKYFEIDAVPYRRFEIENLLEERHGYGRNWTVYLTERDYLDETERETLGRRIRDYVNRSNMRFPALSLDNLREIDRIISSPKNT